MPVSSVEQKVSVANAYLMKNDMFQNYANNINIGRRRPVGGAEQGRLHQAGQAFSGVRLQHLPSTQTQNKRAGLTIP